MPAPATVLQLRELLAERFPSAPARAGACLPTGIAPFDAQLRGGLSKSAITELICPGAGGAFLTVSLLRAAGRREAGAGRRVAFIDGQDCFDPQPLDNAVLSHLLWARCENAAQALRAADLLLRDGNLPLVLMDLCRNPAAELRRIPLTSWYRLQRIVEKTSTAFLAFTPCSLIGGAQVKLRLRSRFTLEALEMEEAQLWEQLEFTEAWGARNKPKAAGAGAGTVA